MPRKTQKRRIKMGIALGGGESCTTGVSHSIGGGPNSKKKGDLSTSRIVKVPEGERATVEKGHLDSATPE